MSRVFRKIRAKLLGNEKSIKYILYAAGEILLITVGILIALWINNRNEQKKTDKKISSILNQMKAELQDDVIELGVFLKSAETKRDVAIKILSDSISLKDYKYNTSNIFLLLHHGVFNINDNAYVNLMSNLEDLPMNAFHLRPLINEVYMQDKVFIDDILSQIEELTENLLQKLANEKDWFSELMQGKFSTESLDYFASSKEYRNQVALFNILNAQNLILYLNKFESDAKLLYNQLAELDGSEVPIEMIVTMLDEQSFADIEGFEGLYQGPGSFQGELSFTGNILHLQGTNQEKIALDYEGDSTFTHSVGIVLKLLQNGNMELTQSGQAFEFKKLVE